MQEQDEQKEKNRPLFAFYASVSKFDEEKYAAKNPHACIVYPNKINPNTSDLYATTQLISPMMLKKASGTSAEKAGFEMAVALLEKTTRNPFREHIYLGRAANNDIVILDESISKAHAFFEQVGNDWYVTDVESKNGTIVHSQMLTPRRAEKIADGERLQFGSVLAQFFTPRGFHRHVLALFQKSVNAP